MTGKVAEFPESYLGHPVLGKYLEPCDPEGCTSCGFNSEPEPEPVQDETVVESATDFITSIFNPDDVEMVD